MTIGIEQFRTRSDLWLDWMLIQPLRGYASDTRSTWLVKRSDACG